ncbi:hypothetical protein Leryth_023034 [Lithospermum erythrorhizon]|uniref:Uncharacterized protein n=1 Tax=Lithospermum erythrorhizon TaxID=34254 RepID=A0AAV3RLQ8_LITER|nr:hypothetical protein Leryth_023034 [Lithospermum erythrorhizon]
MKKVISVSVDACLEKMLTEINILSEVNKSNTISLEEQSDLSVQNVKQLQNRIIFGLGIGCSLFLLPLLCLHGQRSICAPRYVSRVSSVICALMPILTL